MVSNTLDLQAFIAGGTISKTVSATAVITIGDWPNCFYFSDEHDSWGNEKTAELKAINLLMTYPRYRAGLCQNPQRPIKLILDTTSFGDECEVTGDSTIIIRKLCLGGEANRFYSLAHESGHIYSKRNSDVYIEFINYFRDVIVANGENYLCSYRGTKTPSEDFAETIAVYLTNKNFANRPYNTCISSANPNGWINLRDNYPYHYSFAAKGYFD